MYEQGQGVAKDFAKAISWYGKAAAQKNAIAANNLGVLYRDGRGVPANASEAEKWFRIGADAGDINAQSNLAQLLEQSKPADALAYYRKAAEQGVASAQGRLGWLIMKSGGDAKEAAQWLNKAAEQGDAAAQNNLGVLYELGQGVDKDPVRAANWYQKAAEQGDAAAQNNIGVMYRDGAGVSQNMDQAIAWFRRSAQQGYTKAMLNLGGIYERMMKASAPVAAPQQTPASVYQPMPAGARPRCAHGNAADHADAAGDDTAADGALTPSRFGRRRFVFCSPGRTGEQNIR